MFGRTTAHDWGRVILLPAFAILFAASSAPGAVLYVDASASGASDGSSWTDAFNNPQDAVATADARNSDADPDNDVSEIWVAGGTYMPDGGYKPVDGVHVPGNGDRTGTFQLLNGVALYGGFAGGETSLDQRDITANETILSGDLLDNDTPVPCTENSPACDSFGLLCAEGFCIIRANNEENTYHVVSGSATDTTALIDGFTLTAGNANGASGPGHNRGGALYNDFGSLSVVNCAIRNNAADANGGGMFNVSDSRPMVAYSTFDQNWAGFRGGAMYNGDASSPTVQNCTFQRNMAFNGGGMSNAGGSTPIISHTKFTVNSAIEFGGAMLNAFGSPQISNCIFDGNIAGLDGAGMSNAGSSPLVQSCLFRANLGRSGAGIFNFRGSHPILTNCALIGNSAIDYGGGMANSTDSNPIVTNSTFIWNSADIAGGAMRNVNSGPMVANCIIWGNPYSNEPDGSGHIETQNGTPVVNYSILQGGWSGAGGVGVIDADPMFVDPLGPDGIPGTADDDLRLMLGSPAIDAGDNDAVPEGITTDLDGQPRFIDHPDTPDTGNPGAIGPPIVDMGAYEFQGLCPDADGDGVCDVDDACPESISDQTIVIDGCDSGVDNVLFADGCTMSDLIRACGDTAANHGAFVRCVTRLTNDWAGEGILRPQDKGPIQRCAARASIPG